MPEYGQRQVLGAGAKLHGDHHLLHKIGSRWPHNMATKYAVGLRVRENLYHAIRIIGKQHFINKWSVLATQRASIESKTCLRLSPQTRNTLRKNTLR